MVSPSRVAAHYRRNRLAEDILAALAASGKAGPSLSVDDLAPVDEFHTRGRQASIELGQGLHLAAGHRVLDVGSGIGGPSRWLAHAYGCFVFGIDLTDAYCQTADRLAHVVGLRDRVRYACADALDMPFANGTFDRVYTQHVAMNIADKARLYGEIHRVLGPDGFFGLFDLLQGEGGEVLLPAPWAKDATTSFLVPPEALRSLLSDAGFEILSWRDTSREAIDWLDGIRRARRAGNVPSIGLHVLLGEDFTEMMRNQARNLAEGRAIPTEVICRRR